YCLTYIIMDYFKARNGDVTISGTTYRAMDIRASIPYAIDYHKDTGDYYFMNRDYMYTGYPGVKHLGEIKEVNDVSKYNRIYLYIDACAPWEDKKYMLEYIRLYNEHTAKLSKCRSSMGSVPAFVPRKE